MTENIVVRRRDERYQYVERAEDVLPPAEWAVYSVMRDLAIPMTHRDLTATMKEYGYAWGDRAARDACLRLVNKGWARRTNHMVMGPNGPEHTYRALKYKTRVLV